MSREKRDCWGWHLILDLGGCNEAINDPILVKQFLAELVIKLDMHPIGPPQVIYVDTDEGKGVTGVQIITTSTITFHGDDDGKCVYLDVFSCKYYDPNIVTDLVDEYFLPKTYKTHWIKRNADV